MTKNMKQLASAIALLAVIGASGTIAHATGGDGVAAKVTSSASGAATVVVSGTPNVIDKSTASTTWTISCATLSTTATVLAANANRVWFAVWTTSGSATIYVKAGTGAAVGGATSFPLEAGGSYADAGGQGGKAYNGLVSAVAKTGSVWTCTAEVAP